MKTIKYKDFLPAATERGGLFGGVDFSGFDTCVVAMNQWVAEQEVEIMRLESVILPNIHNVEEEGTTDTELHASAHTIWYQFLRVWYYAD